ncbi:hypothetical protein [Tunicatimonas pelagia]|uniref:hypothetical protein n=1 Tax=Tunicatimonas pelagia TaxID=931531 RepID=UPI0026651956|nr:hypothetical protein [Tunicatimonas pelagia]WKN46201.1 hypothetical protein P0M28_14705 [Tunicatimonas pelagia]
MRTKILVLSLLALTFLGCEQQEVATLDESILADYIQLNRALDRTDLIACAGGRPEGLLGDTASYISVFFYPIEGAYDFRYFESEQVDDILNFSHYRAKELPDSPILNGYLRQFENPIFEGNRVGIVTYKTPGKLHVCNPIRLKFNTTPTEVNEALLTIEEQGVNPTFSWADGQIPDNAIYFQIVSDLEDNLISGTYTFERNFTFYDLENVVLNITDPNAMPALTPNQNYRFTMMGVSEDNWINLWLEQEFRTQ